MNSGGSVIKSILDRIRSYSENPDIDAKYQDDYLMRNAVYPAMADIHSRLSLSADNPVLSRHDFTIDPDTPFYDLPSCVGQVWALGTLDELERLTLDWKPNRAFHWAGTGWSLEGSTIRVDPSLTTATTLSLLYVSNGDAMFHYSENGNLSYHDGVSRFQIGPTEVSGVTLGGMDRRPNAYLGQTLRLLGTNEVWEERVIERAWEVGGLYFVETRTPFTKKLVGANLTYEVVPCTGSQPWIECVALSASVILAVWRREPQKHQDSLNYRYRTAIKTIKDITANMQMRTPKSYTRQTADNPGSFFSLER